MRSNLTSWSGKRTLSRSAASFLVVCGLAGCTGPAKHAGSEQALPFSGIDSRATLVFENTFLFKPSVGETQRVEVLLAPLILREIAGQPAGHSSGDLRPAGIAADLGPHSGTNSVVYFRRGEVTLSGKRHPQMAYYWSAETDSSSECALPLQGVRLTLDSAGAPIIWEVLADCTGAELLFVAESVERAARARFGRALPGRRFVSERSLVEAPTALVARVLEDGPVPMGPVVYTRASGEVGTVICRCMPAQAQRLSGQLVYELVEISEVEEAELLAARIGQFLPATAVSFEHWFWPDRLNERLRWPGAEALDSN